MSFTHAILLHPQHLHFIIEICFNSLLFLPIYSQFRFLLFRTPEAVPKLVSLLAESFNPHVSDILSGARPRLAVSFLLTLHYFCSKLSYPVLPCLALPCPALPYPALIPIFSVLTCFPPNPPCPACHRTSCYAAIPFNLKHKHKH